MKWRGISNSQNYSDLFQDWEIAIATKLVKDFQSSSKWFQLEDVEDLLQECLTHWFFTKEKYDSRNEASIQTFMSKVVRNKLKDLARERKADKRKASCQAISLDKPIDPYEDSPSLIDTIESDGLSEPPQNSFNAICARLDLMKVREKLSLRQKQLFDVLQDSKIQEASRILGILPSTIYEELKRMRAIFEKERLKDYLE